MPRVWIEVRSAAALILVAYQVRPLLFDVFGPFEITRHGPKRLITKQSRKDLQKALDEAAPGLANACGCYLFAKRAGRGMVPYYVGQACKSSLVKEALNSGNITNYNHALDGAGTPVLFLMPARTPGGKFRKRPSAGRIAALDFLEGWLIAEALAKNPDLINMKQTRFLRDLKVTGLLNAERGESTAASQQLKRALYR